MTKPELGAKHTCQNCGAKYYDLNRTPIVCPRCGTPLEAVTARPRPQPVAKPAEVAAKEPAVVDKAEVVSLVEADEEAAESGKVKVAAGADGDDDEEETIEGGENVFLEDEEDDDEDVEQIIGDVDDEER